MLQILNGKKISAVNSLTIYQCLTNTEFTSPAKSDEGTTSPMLRLSGRYLRRSSHSCEQTAEDEVGLSYALLYYDITWQIGNLLYNSHFRILSLSPISPPVYGRYVCYFTVPSMLVKYL